MNFFQTFRVRLLFILAILLIATLGVQYYLNLQTERQNERLRETQQQVLVAGVSIGFNGLSSSDRMRDFIKREDQAFDETTINRINDIIVINKDWEVYDSLNENYLPTQNEKKETVYKKLKDISDLPPLVNASRLGNDRSRFPNADLINPNSEAEAHAIPIETDQGRWYVMIILKTDKKDAFQKAAQPLVYTLAVLLISTLITILGF